MIGPVDVLAVMDDCIRSLRRLGASGMARGAELDEARAAVAELIEAARGVADNIILGDTTCGKAIRAALANIGSAP